MLSVVIWLRLYGFSCNSLVTRQQNKFNPKYFSYAIPAITHLHQSMPLNPATGIHLDVRSTNNWHLCVLQTSLSLKKKINLKTMQRQFVACYRAERSPV